MSGLVHCSLTSSRTRPVRVGAYFLVLVATVLVILFTSNDYSPLLPYRIGPLHSLRWGYSKSISFLSCPGRHCSGYSSSASQLLSSQPCTRRASFSRDHATQVSQEEASHYPGTSPSSHTPEPNDSRAHSSLTGIYTKAYSPCSLSFLTQPSTQP